MGFAASVGQKQGTKKQDQLGRAWLEVAKAMESQGFGKEVFPCLCVELIWVLRG